MMKIGIDCRLYSPNYTGIGRYVYEMVKHLAELDTVNQYVLFFNQKEFDSFEVPNERWQKRLVNIPHYSFAEQWRFYQILQKEKLDLVHFPHFNAPILYRKPFVVTIHDLTLHYYPYKEYAPKWSLKKALQIFFYRFLMGQVVKHSKHIISVSENTKRDLLKEYSLSSEKINTIHEGVPDHFQKSTTEEIQAIRQKFQISKPYLLYTGVWRSHKNLLNLLKAFRKLLDQGLDYQLVFTGKKDPAYPEIPRLIQDLNLTDRVILTGFVSDEELIALMSGAQVYVFPSLYEGFGLPPLEAMQLEVPVACSNTSSLPEVCGDAAVFFDPKDPTDMANSIDTLLKSPELRQGMIEKGKKNLQRFSWKAMTSHILDKYK
jgi:glycosyltransferase involved in cell wall biosynthesis